MSMALFLAFAIMVSASGFAHVGCMELHREDAQQMAQAMQDMPPCHKALMQQEQEKNSSVDCCSDGICAKCVSLSATLKNPLPDYASGAPQYAWVAYQALPHKSMLYGLDRPPKILG